MRVVRSVAALATLLGGLVGVPLLLRRLGAQLWPAVSAPGRLTELVARLSAPDDGSLLAGLFLIAAWLAWAVFALSVLLELVNLLARGRVRVRLPGLGGPQRMVAGLLLAVVALGAVQAGGHADAAPNGPSAKESTITSAPVVAPSAGRPTETRTDSDTRQHTHVVVAGDDLWSLAEHYYGEGQQWRRIAGANPDRLTGGPDRLQVGTRLVVPDVGDGQATTVTVVAGDSLSSLAGQAYGDASAWPRIFQANRAAVSDPDQIEVGMKLVVPAAHSPAAHDQPAKKPTGHAPAEHAEPAPPSTDDRAPAAPRSSPAGSSTPSAGPAPSRPGTVAPVEGAPATRQTAHEADTPWIGVAAGVGGLLAAGLGAAALARRRQQLAVRPVGRRIPHPGSATQAVETAVGRRGSQITRDTLDLALRAVGAHARITGRLPRLELVRLSPDGIELVLDTADPRPPNGFSAHGNSWRLDRSGGAVLRARTDLAGQACPYPLLVTLGSAPAGQEILVDLEQAGLLRLAGADTATTDAVQLALGTELALASWADEVTVTVLGRHRALVESFDRPEVRHSAGVDVTLDRLEHRQTLRRSHLGGSTAAHLRLDPELAASWAPEVVLVTADLTADQGARLLALAAVEPATALAVVVADPGHPSRPGAGLELRLGAAGGRDRWPAQLLPHDLTLDAQRLLPPVVDALADLLATTASPDTTPAPWWDGTEDAATSPSVESNHDGDDGDEAADAQAPAPRRAWASEEDPAVVRLRSLPVGDDQVQREPAHHPTVLLLGPIELVGAVGTEPTRAAKQCIEYCAWLLEHPGTTAPAMAAALAVAEGTRRSNMSRLRGWLGDNVAGEPYLPDAYSGRIVLDPAVSSDWQRLQLHTAPRVNQAGTDGLVAALELVRGAPLADAAPGQWHWAEELRTDMTSAIRDIGLELGRRALADHDLDLARWAANRSLAAAPEDERLLGLRLETEHLAGHRAEVERLALRIAGQARTLGVDLDPETVTLLQEVMEGRPRTRVG